MPGNSFVLSEVYGYSRSTVFSDELVVRVCKAMMICAGADGLSPQELEYCLAVAASYGATPEAIEELRKFDFEHGRLEDYLHAGETVIPKRALLYDAIRISHADGIYAQAERAAVRGAAKVLGLEDATVIALEGLVEAELALRKARVSIIRSG